MSERRTAWPQSVRLRAVRYVALLLLLGLALHYFLPRVATLEQSLRVARRLSLWPLLFALFAQVCACIARGWSLSASVAIANERLSLRRSIAIAMAASTVSLVAGGVVAFGASVYRWMRDAGMRRDTATIAAAVPSVFNGVALLAFGLSSAAILLHRGTLGGTAMFGIGIVTTLMLGAVALAVFVVISPARLARSPRLQQIARVVRDAITRGRSSHVALAAVLNLALDLLSLLCVLVASGYPGGVLVLLGGYGVSLLLGRSSLLPGGVAVVEVAMTSSYVSLGVPVEVAVVAVLVYRILSLWLPALAGIPIAVWLQTRRSDHLTA